MSEEQMEEQTMSTEDKFFGVKTIIGGEKADVDVEVVDDRPPSIVTGKQMLLVGNEADMNL